MYRLRIGNTVKRILIRKLRHRIERREKPALLGAIRRVCARSKRLSCLAPVRHGSCSLAVNDIGSDRENRCRGHRVAIRVVALDFAHKLCEQPLANCINALIVIAVAREIALHLVVHCKAALVANNAYLRILDCRERIDGVREAGDASCERTLDIRIDERHLRSLVVVAVMHEVNDVERMDIKPGKPIHHFLVCLQDFCIIERLGNDRTKLRPHLHPRNFIHAAVDGVKKALGQIGARTEELHLLTRLRSGNAAADSVVVAPYAAHDLIVFVLNAARIYRNLRRIILERLGKTRRIEHRKIRLWGRPHRLKRVENTEVGLGDHAAAVSAHTAQVDRGPHGVAAEKLVVARNAGELDHAELHNEMIDKLLRLRLRERTALQIALDINIKERGNAAN